jgi:hypothetical protein
MKKTVKKKLAKKRETPKKKLAKKKPSLKKAAVKTKALGKKTTGAKTPAALRTRARGKGQSVDTEAFALEGLGAMSGGQSGDLQGWIKSNERTPPGSRAGIPSRVSL